MATIPMDVAEVLKQLNSEGFQAYVVGGCVRDSLLGKAPHDWDVCTDALPNDIMRIFSYTIPTGIKHGTVTVLIGKTNVEVTTFRADGDYEDHRHPAEVHFVRSLEEDLARRDFTVNAMAFSSEGQVLDYYGGREDLKNKIIRCVGDPDLRFQEDALRILRAMRFASVLGFSIDPETTRAMARQAHLLKFVSAERIQSELRKMIIGPNVGSILMNHKTPLLQILPEFTPCIGFEQHSVWHCWDVYTHIVQAVETSPEDELVRLALLFHDIGKPHCFTMDESGAGHFHGHGKISAEVTDEILKRLRFDNDTRERVVKLVFNHDVRLEANLPTVRRWVRKIGREDFARFLQIRKADILAQSEYERSPRLEKCDKLDALYQEVLLEKPLMDVRDLALSGYDLMEMGYQPGPEMGRILRSLLEKVLDGTCKNEKEALKACL